VRVFELADEFGWTSMRTLEACRGAGVPARSSGEDLGSDDVERVRAFVWSGAAGDLPMAPVVPSPPAAPTAAPATAPATPTPAPAPAITAPVPILPTALTGQPPGGPSVYARPPLAEPAPPAPTPVQEPVADGAPVPSSIDMDRLPVFEPPGLRSTAGLDPDELATARSLNRARRPGAGGRLAGRIPAVPAPRRVVLLVGALIVLGLIGLFLMTRNGTEEAAPPVTDVPSEQPAPDGAERIQASAVNGGDCLRVTADAATGATVASLLRVACDQPHDFESFAVAEHPDPAGAPFPGDPAVEAFATGRCLELFPGYVGGPYEGSGYQVRFMRPTERSWQEQGDRRVICGLSLPDGTAMVGSAAGTVTANAPSAAEVAPEAPTEPSAGTTAPAGG
jgi:hypothetical protein